MEAGRPHNICPIAPCEARRIEAGIFNYGSHMTIDNNPFEVSGLERLVEPQEADYIGKTALEAIRARGVSRKLVGLEVEGDALPFELSEKRPALHNGARVGTVTDLIWSPRLAKNIGYVWLPIELASPGTPVLIDGGGGTLAEGTTVNLPFLDPNKAIPKS
jgi:glycine cleavage system aminomethyltransferase T